LRWLDEALRRGFDDFKLILVDQDLLSLRGDPRFQSILKTHGIGEQPGDDPADDAPGADS
jgi:hypothetical protein